MSNSPRRGRRTPSRGKLPSNTDFDNINPFNAEDLSMTLDSPLATKRDIAFLDRSQMKEEYESFVFNLHLKKN